MHGADKNYDPVIVFSFSKRDCETFASQLKRLDLTTEDEKKFVEEIFTNAIDSLSEDDRKLPQVQSMLPLLKVCPSRGPFIDRWLWALTLTNSHDCVPVARDRSPPWRFVTTFKGDC